MLDDFDTDLFGNVVLPTLEEVSSDLINDYDLQVISKRKLTPALIHSFNNEYYISDVLCHHIFPSLSSLEIQRFNNEANLRFK